MTHRDICWGCGAHNPSLASDYQHFTALYCNAQCREALHLEAKKKSKDNDGKKRGRLAKAKHSVKKNAGKAAKDAKSAGKVAKVVAPLVVLHPYSDSETASSFSSSSSSESW